MHQVRGKAQTEDHGWMRSAGQAYHIPWEQWLMSMEHNMKKKSYKSNHKEQRMIKYGLKTLKLL